MMLDDIIILSLHYSENEIVAGRTLFQKILYFLNKKLDLEIDFNPYYYGPYSRKVASEIENLNACNIISEEIKEYKPIDFHGAFEPRKYIYRLNESGRVLAEQLERDDPDLANSIKESIAFMQNKGATNNYKTLSIAAKMDNILELENKTMSVEEILDEAKVLGWRISHQEAINALDLLFRLQMIKEG